MKFDLKDCTGHNISIGDIIKHVKNSKNDSQIVKTEYYLYSEDKLHNPYLFLYDQKGDIALNSFSNIHIDIGVTLINDSKNRWTRIGLKEEVYNTIFKITSK